MSKKQVSHEYDVYAAINMRGVQRGVCADSLLGNHILRRLKPHIALGPVGNNPETFELFYDEQPRRADRVNAIPFKGV